MPGWLLSLLVSFLSTVGIPALKVILVAIFKNLEKVHPGSANLFEALIVFLEGGGSAAAVQAHLNATLPGFKPAV